MKILLDPQIFNDQEFGGISRYYTEIFSRLSQFEGVSIDIPIVMSKNVYLTESLLLGKQLRRHAYFSSLLSMIGISIRKKTKKIHEMRIFDAFKNNDFDLFIPTYYDPYFLDYIDNKPFVLTVYDMVHELFPEYFIDDPHEVVKRKKLLIEKATKIIAVSNNTKKDILKIYPDVDDAKIHVIYHGNSLQINTDKQIDLPKNYILFVGRREYYKNFYFLVKAIKSLLEKDKSLQLVCAGGDEFNEEEIKFIDDLKLSKQIIQKSFIDSDLGSFYKNAKCFVFPSAYEGFGIPVLESMACGCPIVLTQNSSFPEVAADAGLFFTLNDENDLKNKINLLLEDENLRQSYSERGLLQSKKFDWDEAAKQCFEVYFKAL